MRQLDLQEYRKSAPIALSFAEQRTLRSILPSLRIEPSDAEGEYTLTPGSTVGAVETNGLSVLIQPKISIPRLLSLACYAIGKVEFQASDFDFPHESAPPDFLALALAKAARSAFSRGLLHGYLEQEEALLTVRGRIQFGEQLRRRPGMLLPIETRYDEFTSDILQNQLVKAAAMRLARASVRSSKAREGLGWISTMLGAVSHREWPPRDVPEVRFDGLNERYRNVLALSILILRHGAFEFPRGLLRASGFLMDMNAIFQEFVTVALREKLNLSPRAFGERRITTLDEERRVSLEPDLVWRDAGLPVFVGDAKYKKLADDSAGPPNADLYQLLAYAVALDLPGGLLVYAKGEEDPAIYTIRNSGKRLEVAALDLSGSLDNVLERIKALAGAVRRLRYAARRPRAAA